jgi:hypothetical protein
LVNFNIFSCRPTKAKEPFHCPGGSNELSVVEERDLQVPGSTDWASIIWGTAVAVGALFLVGRELQQNRNNE